MLLRAAIVLFAFSLPVLAEDQVIQFGTDDAEMNAAIDKARDTLPAFWASFAKPAADETDFALKLGISDGTNTEHFWCGEIEGDAKSATCAIANEPAQVFTVSLGERITVNPEIISDWMYYRGDKIVGGQTIRVMLPHLDKKEAASLRAILSDD